MGVLRRLSGLGPPALLPLLLLLLGLALLRLVLAEVLPALLEGDVPARPPALLRNHGERAPDAEFRGFVLGHLERIEKGDERCPQILDGGVPAAHLVPAQVEHLQRSVDIGLDELHPLLHLEPSNLRDEEAAFEGREVPSEPLGLRDHVVVPRALGVHRLLEVEQGPPQGRDALLDDLGEIGLASDLGETSGHFDHVLRDPVDEFAEPRELLHDGVHTILHQSGDRNENLYSSSILAYYYVFVKQYFMITKRAQK